MDPVAVHPMNGGNDQYSYTKNSTGQRQLIEATNEFITKAVEKLDISTFLSSKTIQIADLGCSTGPNTFLAVQNIIDSFEQKFCESKVTTPEFHIFFSDLASNDFNQLFLSLPRDRKYFAAGVPGSFHGPLFPKHSLHFVQSSSSLHWLSMVPPEVTEKSSPAWNNGKIHYSNAVEEVARAYETRFGKDMQMFLRYRAEEIVDGGLMALIILGRPNGTPHSETSMNKGFQVLEHALEDMVKEGKVSNEQLNLFNIPVYNPSLEEVESMVKQYGCFSIETLEDLNVTVGIPHLKVIISSFRAAMEGMIKEHFGKEVSDDLFDTVLPKKFLDFSADFESSKFTTIFVVLKRKTR